MKRILFALIAVAAPWPASAQGHVYTNSDLGKPLAQVETVTAAQLERLRMNQFQPAENHAGPALFIIDSRATDGPYGPFHLAPDQPLGPIWNYVVPGSYFPYAPYYSGIGPFGATVPLGFGGFVGEGSRRANRSTQPGFVPREPGGTSAPAPTPGRFGSRSQSGSFSRPGMRR